jgi:hypothetical protein
MDATTQNLGLKPNPIVTIRGITFTPDPACENCQGTGQFSDHPVEGTVGR